MAHSYTFGLWIPRANVSETDVQSAIRDHGPELWNQGLSATLYRLPKPASVFVSIPLDDHDEPFSVFDASAWDACAGALAERIQAPVYALFAFAGTKDFLAVSAFDQLGGARWKEQGEDASPYAEMARELSLKFERLSFGVSPVLEPVGEDWQLGADVPLVDAKEKPAASSGEDDEDDFDDDLDDYELNLDGPTLEEIDSKDEEEAEVEAPRKPVNGRRKSG